MTVQAVLTLLILGAALALLVRNLVAPGLAIFGADVALLLTGVLSPEQALAGFSNPAPFTVASLFVVAAAVEKTGVLRPLVRRLLKESPGGGHGLGRMLSGVAGASGFLNNTPVVAMLAPEVQSWADRRGRPPSRYLLPLSFASILGGTITVIGTSTTILVSGLLESHGEPPIGMFEITRLGLPLALVGIVYLWLASPRLLPVRRTALEEFEEESREFTVRVRVKRGGPLDGEFLEATDLASLRGVYVARIDREEGEVVAPVGPRTLLRGGDRLTVLSTKPRLADLRKEPGLATAAERLGPELTDLEHAYLEAVVGGASPLGGHTLKEVGFRERYGGVVLGIHRPGEGLTADPSEVRLRTGDTLFILAGVDFEARWKNRHDFVFIHTLEEHPVEVPGKGLIAGVVVAGVVGLAASGALSVLEASFLGFFAVLGTRLLTIREAVRAIDLDVVTLIAAAFGLGTAVEVTGIAGAVAGGLIAVFGTLGPLGLFMGLVLATVVLTELVTNNAAAVLLFPIALSVALDAGLEPRPVVLAVAVAASMSFLTPIGYQTNTMVYGPGGYRFSDYTRLGLPLTLMAIVLLPLLATML